MGSEVRHDAGRQAGGRGMRLLRTVGRPELVGPVTQRNIGVWLGLGLIVFATLFVGGLPLAVMVAAVTLDGDPATDINRT